MIVGMKKMLFIGASSDLSSFLRSAQKLACLEVIPNNPENRKSKPTDAEVLERAIKILKKQPHENPQRDPSHRHSNLVAKAKEVLELYETLINIEDKIKETEAEIFRIEPFGQFALDEVDSFQEDSNLHIQFFCSKTQSKDREDYSELIWIGHYYDLDYFVSICKGERAYYPDLIEVQFKKSLKQLREEKKQLKNEEKESHQKLHQLTVWRECFESLWFSIMTEFALECAHLDAGAYLEGKIFSVAAWIPESKIYLMPALLNNFAIHAEEIRIEEEERIPTYMENGRVAQIGEDLVKIYDAPSIHDKDPSMWILVSFVLFFSMIVGDAGYGIIYLAIAFYLQKKIPNLKGSGKRLIQLAKILALGCVVWGLMTSSIFGISLPENSFVKKFSIMEPLSKKKLQYHIDQQDDVYETWKKVDPQVGVVSVDNLFATTPQPVVVTKMKEEFTKNILMEFSLALGVLHIGISLFRYLRRNYPAFGWLIFLAGGYLYFPTVLKSTTMLHILFGIPKDICAEWGLQAIYIGVGLAMGLAVYQRKLAGLGEIANLVSIFGDVLSYLRIYALSLAGAIMAQTFNAIGEGIGLVLGVVVILAGHFVNLLLSIQGGVIHGLRLNFLEWYHYCFEGGGRFFRPLKEWKQLQGDD